MPATNELLQEGRYRINLQTPLDGKANVYEAYDTVREANVVVKEISAGSGGSASAKTELETRAKALTAIDHESLIQVHDYFTETGRQYVVMESVDGDDLAELLVRNKSAFAVSDVTEWADQILDALNYLHTLKPAIFHRNVRPENLKLNSTGKVKLLAMGTTDGDATDASINYSPLELIWDGLDAASQKIILSGYDDRSERLLKEPADARSDIYSLGATLYHLVTGRAPVDPLERSIEMLEGNADPLAAPHTVDSKIPVELSEVMMRALEIKRENRFDSAVIMRQVVRTAVVRANERVEEATRREEARELAEAAEDIRLAEESRSAPKPTSADKEQKQRQEALAKQLREAEAQKAAAEKLKADALAKEKQAAEAAKRAEEERAKKEAQERAQAEADAVLKELKQDLLEIDAEPVEEVAAVTSEETSGKKKSKAAAAAAGSTTSEPTPVETAVQSDEIELGGMFAEKPAAKGGMGIAMIGGIAGVLLVVAVAGWLLLSSGGSTPEQRPTAAPPVVQIPPTEPQQTSSSVASAAPETTAPAAQPAAEVQPQQASLQNRTAAQPVAAKAKKDEKETPKPAEKKKSVTVDDLINDN